MELRPVEIFVAERCTEQRGTMPAGCRRVGAEGGIIGVDEVDVRAGGDVFEEFPVQVAEGIPAHVRNTDLRLVGETFYMRIEYADAFHGSFLGIAAEHLEPDADTEHGTAQGADDGNEPFFAQAVQGAARVADTGQDDPPGRPQPRRVGGDFITGAQSFEGVGDRADVAGRIIDDGDHRIPLLLGSS